MSDNVDMTNQENIAAELLKHRDGKYYGPRQKAGCLCGKPFYPKSGRSADILDAHLAHQAAALSMAGFGAPSIMREWILEHRESAT